MNGCTLQSHTAALAPPAPAAYANPRTFITGIEAGWLRSPIHHARLYLHERRAESSCAVGSRLSLHNLNYLVVGDQVPRWTVPWLCDCRANICSEQHCAAYHVPWLCVIVRT
jgi:hypothetical protein